jgi:hypothetical protein
MRTCCYFIAMMFLGKKLIGMNCGGKMSNEFSWFLFQWYSKFCFNALIELFIVLLFSSNWIDDLFLCAEGVKFCILVFFNNTQKG